MKLESNVLYRVSYNWNNQVRWGVGFAYNLGIGERIHIGISLPEGGVMNIAADEAISIGIYKIK